MPELALFYLPLVLTYAIFDAIVLNSPLMPNWLDG